MTWGEIAYIFPITNGSNLIEVTWQDSSLVDCANCLDVSVNPYFDTQYILEVTSVDGCSTTDEILIRVNKVRDVYIPNIFTPNGDGANDWFFVQSGKAVELIQNLRVYNRWGGLMFEQGSHQPNDPSLGWDGRWKGDYLNPGVFVWQIKVKYLDGEVLDFSGDVAILR